MQKLSIQSLIQNFYSSHIDDPIRNRFKSWEHCHKAFIEAHKKGYENLNEDDIKLLCLHLSFCLASFGMYRGSSFLIESDYLANKSVVELIFEPIYEPLWDFNPANSDINLAHELLFNETFGVYNRIKNDCYLDSDYLIVIEDNKKISKRKANKPSSILITKILMITFGCIPAFDTLVSKTIGPNPKKIFRAICEYVKTDPGNFVCKSNDVYYPPMRCLDILLWCLGYVSEEIKNYHKKSINKDKLIDELNDFGIFSVEITNKNVNLLVDQIQGIINRIPKKESQK